MWTPSRSLVLWLLVAVFLGVSAVFGWSLVYHAQTTFRAGTRPPLREENLPPPVKPTIRPTDPIKGSVDPRAITIIEFGDFDCVFCRLAAQSIDEALATMKDARLVWRDLPIPNGRPYGMLAAIAGRCAAEQGKFWQMHDALYNANDLKLETIKKAADAVGLKANAFDDCLSNGKIFQAVQDDVSLARSLRLTSAPTMFIGDEVLMGAVSVADLTGAIKRARAAGR